MKHVLQAHTHTHTKKKLALLLFLVLHVHVCLPSSHSNHGKGLMNEWEYITLNDIIIIIILKNVACVVYNT